jgi:Raf kinase inhibitor-like YbhB/YbcL family protein
MFLLTHIIMALVMNATLTVKSPAFSNNDFIPKKYTCDGASVNPPLTIDGIPEKTQSLAIIMDDPDAPKGTFDHWVVWNIPVVKEIKENSNVGTTGKNGRKENKYTGPCPPSGTHHYHFKVYALNSNLDLPDHTTKDELLKAIDGKILGMGELIGLYDKK